MADADPRCGGSLRSFPPGHLERNEQPLEGRRFRELHDEPASYATPRRLLDGAIATLDGLDGPPVQPESGGS